MVENTSLSGAIYRALFQIFRGLAKILLQHGVSSREATELLRRAFVDAAATEFRVNVKRETDSRISVMTGISRADVARIRQLHSITPDDKGWLTHNRAARVVTAWANNKNLTAELSLLEFENLVLESSGGSPYQSVLEELQRVGTVEVLPEYRIKLLRNAYVPHNSSEAMLRQMGSSVGDLLKTISHNLSQPQQDFLQLVTESNEIAKEDIKEFEAFSSSKVNALMHELAQWLEKREKKTRVKGTGASHPRVGVGFYYFEDSS